MKATSALDDILEIKWNTRGENMSAPIRRFLTELQKMITADSSGIGQILREIRGSSKLAMNQCL